MTIDTEEFKKGFEVWVTQFGDIGRKKRDRLWGEFRRQHPETMMRSPERNHKHKIQAQVPITTGMRGKIAQRIENAYITLKGKTTKDFLKDKELLSVLMHEHRHAIKILMAIKDLYDLEKEAAAAEAKE